MASSLSFIPETALGHFVSTPKSLLEITVRFRGDTTGVCVDLGLMLPHRRQRNKGGQRLTAHILLPGEVPPVKVDRLQILEKKSCVYVEFYCFTSCPSTKPDICPFHMHNYGLAIFCHWKECTSCSLTQLAPCLCSLTHFHSAARTAAFKV